MTARKTQDAQDAQDTPQASKWPAGVKVSPLALAGLMMDPADAPHGLGGTAGKATADRLAKRLRSIARATLAEYQDEGYTVHEYDETAARSLVATYTAKGRRSSGTGDLVRAAFAAGDEDGAK